MGYADRHGEIENNLMFKIYEVFSNIILLKREFPQEHMNRVNINCQITKYDTRLE